MMPSALKESVEISGDRGALFGQRCRHCGMTLFPIREMCPQCGGSDLERRALSGVGKVFSWSAVHRAAAGWKVPYTIALVDFPEGPRIFSQVRADASSMRVGMDVRVAFGRPPAGQPEDVYYFVPEKG